MPTDRNVDSDPEAKESVAEAAGNSPAATGIASGTAKASKPGRLAPGRRASGTVEPTEVSPEVEVLGPGPRERVRLGEALREQGIDEHAVAETYADVVDKLKGKTQENDSVEKLLVDILKECSKHLEEDAKAAGNSAVRVTLVHNVARPQRGALAPEAPASAPDIPVNPDIVQS
ncbi:MAG TPA: hypothetical protein VLY23_18345 [Candidatus Acidoferrum sp.]|nr:hypothetical protein [Candidatus Acidoferrum sp.]